MDRAELHLLTLLLLLTRKEFAHLTHDALFEAQPQYDHALMHGYY